MLSGIKIPFTMSIHKTIMQFVILMTLIIAGSHQAFATHAAGSDIKYRYLGGMAYEIEVTFYRDCGGVAEPANITVNCKSVNGSSNFNVTANKVATNNGTEITVPCLTSNSNCNGGGSTGIRKWTYRATVTLPSAQTDWVFSYSVCCRNCSITTIVNPCASNSVLYIEATLNNVISANNSSPTFSNIPIAFVCIGQPFNFNHGVLDIDGDSLRYDLITPKTSATANVTYISPASATTPIASSTPFSINSVTGDLNFTPSQVQIGIMAIRVREFRNGQLIGSVIRDMQVYTQACTNNLPTASGINGTNNFSITTCPNQQLCFTVNTADLDASQIVSLTTNSGIQGATYSISSGPRPTLTFCWTPTFNDIDLNPKTFTVTVRDNACPNNGIQTYSFNIYVPSPYFSLTGTNISCNGGNTGTASVTPVFSGNNYTYLWSNGSTTTTVNNLTAGTYSVTGTDISGCSATQTIIITEPSGMTLSTSLTNPSCIGVNNGSIDLSVVGGVTPYSYLWSGGQTTQDLSLLPAGTYTVTVTDGNGCSKNTTVTLSPSYALNLSASSTNVNCTNQSTGSITTSLTGGVVPINYNWSNGATSQNLSNLSAGTFTVIVTDANGCSATASNTITQPASSVALTLQGTNITCFNAQNGSITSNATGGTPSYTYLWNNGSTASSLTNIQPGTYSLTVTDANGCSVSSSTTLSQPNAQLAVNTTQTNLSCHANASGSINTNTIGGTTPYTYNWSNGVTTANQSNLSAGTYTLTVTDSKGCTTSTTVTLTQPIAALSSVATPTAINCFGNATGSINLNTNGGTTPYSYLWSNGATSQNITNVLAGIYIVTITDANGCKTNTNATVTQPLAALSLSTSKTNVKCFGNNTGSITTTVSGGTSPYTYSWNNGATTSNLSNIAAGTYIVTVTDSRNCTQQATVTVLQPTSPLSTSSTQTDVRCFGDAIGAVSVAVSGGTSPYSYNWNNGASTSSLNNITSGNYNITVTDAQGCTTTSSFTIAQPAASLSANTSSTNVSCRNGNNATISISVSGGTPNYSYSWSNGANTSTVSNLESGIYTVIVTDSKGCTINKTVTITEPAQSLSSSISSQNISCFGFANGSINLTVNGGTPSYTYNWSNGVTSKDQTGLLSGIYNVTITDANGCTTTNFANLTQPNSVLSVSLDPTNVSCHGTNTGSITANVIGGTYPYSYLWNNNATTSSIQNLIPGNYNAIVTDANGCTAQSSSQITQPSQPIQLSETHTNINCLGNGAGRIDLTVQGGTSPYSYNWSNGSTSQDVSFLPSGSYTVTVTDANNCIASLTITITQPAGSLQSSANVTDILCYQGNNGAIDLTVTMGTPPYNYNWSNGSTSQDISNLIAGTYSVTITDDNGCVLANQFFVTEPLAALGGNFNVTDVGCYGNSTGEIDLNTTGGTSPYNYNWSNGSTTEDMLNIASGNYSVSITDANGCTTILNTSVAQPTAPLSIVSTVTNINCYDIANGAINITVSGGTEPYTFLWSNGSTDKDLSSLNVGTYTLTVTDNNGCTISETRNIIYNNLELTSTVSATTVNCYAGNNGEISLVVSGGQTPYQYSWNNGAYTISNPQNLVAGTYNVIITDANGCTTSNSISVQEPIGPLNSTAIVENILCYGNSTGVIDLTTIGGTFPYTFNWSNGSNSEDLIGISSNTYTVLITDSKGCTFELPVTVTSPLAPISIQPTLTNVGCYGDSSGAISTLITGGTPSYSILWNGQIGTNNLSNISAGNYTIQVTDSNGCLANQSIDITQPVAALSVSPSVVNIDCNGNSSGTIDLNPSGGTAPYNTTWNNGFNGSTLTGASSGNYQYTIVDANQCTITGTADINQPPNALSVSETISNVSCNGLSNGAVILSTGGGTTPYTYLWSNGSTNADLTNVPAGNYTVTVTDANGCIYTKSYPVSEPTQVLSIQQQTTQVSCYGDNTGAISITPNGGTAPYNYSWNTGSTNSSISNLFAGNYSVLVTDANGCTSNLISTITQPTNALNSTATTSNVNCYGNTDGSINLTPSGGTAPYTYLWNNGATTQNLNGLVAGTYTVTVTDANQCSYVYSALIQQPIAALTTTYLFQDVACFGGATGIINSNPSGGTSPYTYVWSNGVTSANLSNVVAGTYTLTITDVNGCTFSQPVSVSQPLAAVTATNTSTNINCYGNLTGSINISVSGGLGNYTYQWNNGATTEDLNALAPGNYTVVVTDQNGCTTTTSASISQPSMSPNINVISQPVSCFGMQNGAVNSTTIGGTGPYTYLWNTGATTDNISGVSAGTYTVTVTDNNGCSISTSTNVTEPTAILDANLTISAANCITNQMGNINVSVLGGTAPFNYLWNNGGTVQNLLNQPPGSYWVKVTDANGCEVTKNANIDDLTSVTISTNDMEICIGSTATISTTSISGATYQWQYNGNALSGATSNTFITPVAGIYTVVVTTACGTYTSNPIEITVRTLNTVTVSNDVIICNGESFQLQAGGGMDYSWSPTNGLNQTNIPNPVASPSQTTTYTVTVRDAGGCTATASVTVTVMCDTLDIPNGFSPNNDGTNDYFVIDGIDAYPGNVLFIYNRWGNLIYKQKDYANKWDGRSNVNGVMFGQELPNGTYYFILDLNIDQKPVNGFVVIRR